ncbi:exopolyphosphatase [Ferrimonas lipolytica]|uniref:Exopolyphosphatase n=1 Tax=Ferrimonas lipolytica TaxID=2724191 RepID=A0A6H1UFY1_9GAMM|nr:exopolyphosphatase [Ferrimonas lipolytica]QIZ77991.1 exopolyphosphatase [Ferrimonas lipolytica]
MAGAHHVDTTDAIKNGGLMVAITLGSNSFNMLVAKPGQSFPLVIAKHKRKVRLATGLVVGGCLAPAAKREALDCLQWFGELIQQYQPEQTAIYATAALRQAADAELFCQQALPLLGQRIEIISGEQEAEFIFHGMRATTATDGQVMMLDIGGASTELVIGDEHIDFKHSLPLGAVLFNQRHFATGISAAAFAAAHTDVEQALTPLLPQLSSLQWQHAMGISGTFRSLFELAQNRGLGFESISRTWLNQIREELLQHGSAELAGVETERVPTFAAGVAILLALMNLLDISDIYPAGGALREGVLVQLALQQRLAHNQY